ncbi:MAG: hypothetical protein PHG11_08020, partial [Eubacteriales bacterium]|nr:hypothetical protein [Eubacteriales bacterium]
DAGHEVRIGFKLVQQLVKVHAQPPSLAASIANAGGLHNRGETKTEHIFPCIYGMRGCRID